MSFQEEQYFMDKPNGLSGTPLPEQGGFNESLDGLLTKLARETTLADRAADIATTPQGVKDASKRYQWSISETKAAIRTLVLEEIIGDDSGYGEWQSTSTNIQVDGMNNLRAEQRKKLRGTHDTK